MKQRHSSSLLEEPFTSLPSNIHFRIFCFRKPPRNSLHPFTMPRTDILYPEPNELLRAHLLRRFEREQRIFLLRCRQDTTRRRRKVNKVTKARLKKQAAGPEQEDKAQRLRHRPTEMRIIFLSLCVVPVRNLCPRHRESTSDEAGALTWVVQAVRLHYGRFEGSAPSCGDFSCDDWVPGVLGLPRR